MSTPEQINANRRNAQKSTGPKTPEGKRIASKNALRHGLLSNDLLLPGEDPSEVARFTGEHLLSLAPVGPRQQWWAERIVLIQRRLDRLARIEAGQYIFERYPKLRVGVLDFEEGQYRHAIEEAVRAQFGAPGPDDTPEQVEARNALLRDLTNQVIETGYLGHAWKPKSQLNLTRIEARLERQLRRAQAELAKLQAHDQQRSSGKVRGLPAA